MLQKVLLSVALGFGVVALPLQSWQAVCLAVLATSCALVEMFMQRAVHQDEVASLAAALETTNAYFKDELAKQKVSIVRLNNKMGLL